MRTTLDLHTCSYANKMNRFNQPWYQDFGMDFGLVGRSDHCGIG